MLRARTLLVAVTLLGLATVSSAAQQPATSSTSAATAGSVDFGRDVQPIFNANCIGCHAGSSPKADLQLDTLEGVLNGGDDGKVVIPGDAKSSLLAQKISDTTGMQMPPQGPLAKEEIATIIAWIDQGAQAGAPAAKPVAAVVTAASTPREIINAYCITCHNQKLKTAGLMLDQVDLTKVAENAAILEKVVHKVDAGMMPPAGAKRPDWDVRRALVTKLEDGLDKNAVINYAPPGIHRLNRTEYQNAIHDLLAVDMDPAKFLPPDDSTRGFDNMAGTLTLSPALLEGYISAAGKISRLAIGDVTDPVETVYIVPGDATQDYHVEGLPFGTRGGTLVKHEFPADGNYDIKISSLKRGNMGATRPFGDIDNEQLEVILDGVNVKSLDWDKETAAPPGSFEPKAIDLKIPVKAGLHTLGVTFLATNYAPIDDHNKHFMRTTIETGGIPGFSYFPHIATVKVIGPFDAKGAQDTASRRKIYVCHPANASQEEACAKQIVSTLARHAYRRPVTDQDVAALMLFYQKGRNGADFDHGIQVAVQRVLADPEFIFRKEHLPENLAAGKAYRISDLELASRLSFFLWSSIPDDQLITLANQGKLRNPAVLQAQVRRMLADPRSEALIDNFAGQWLNLRGMQSQQPVMMLYPDFDDNLRQAYRKETELFFGSIVREDRSVMDLLTANYTFVNERLAKDYGIPNVYGSEFRRVELGPEFDMRRGLLGKGALMTVSSQPGRTSPVQRGKWFLQTFLDVTPPDPPPNVPLLKPVDDAAGGNVAKVPTMREQMEAHRANEPCATCHKIMDPIGFSLENFDAIGRWRTTDGGVPIDASGVLVDGTPLNGVASLRQALLKYSDAYIGTVTENLMTYALGRGVEYYDMPVLRSIDRDAAKNDYRFSSLVLGIVKSPLFQMNTKEPNVQESQERASLKN